LISNQHEYRRLTIKYAAFPAHLEWLTFASKTNKVRRELACLELCKVDWQEWKQKIVIQEQWVIRIEHFLRDVGKVIELYTDHVVRSLSCVETFQQREARLLELRRLYEHMSLCYEIRLEVVWIKVYLERHLRLRCLIEYLPMLGMYYILLRRYRKAVLEVRQRCDVFEVLRECGGWEQPHSLPREIWRNVVACYV
jgi:hypothetical protein